MTEHDKPDLRAERAHRTRAAIRAAAFVLAADKGYEAMTIDDVAALAGVSRRTVFNHVSSKSDLVLDMPLAPGARDIEAFACGTGPLLDDLVALLVAGARATEEGDGSVSEGQRRQRAHQVVALLRDNIELKHAMHDKVRAFTSLLHDAGARRLGLPASDPRVRAIGYLGAAIQRAAIDRWIEEEADGDSLSLSGSVAATGASFAAVLLPDPPGPQTPPTSTTPTAKEPQ